VGRRAVITSSGRCWLRSGPRPQSCGQLAGLYFYTSPPTSRTYYSAADRVFLDWRGALASPVRRACRTGTVSVVVGLIVGHGVGDGREPGRDARMPPGSRTGLRDGRAAGRAPADSGRSGTGGRTPARNHRVGRGSGRRPDAREGRGGVGRCDPGRRGTGGCGCPLRHAGRAITLSDACGQGRTRTLPPSCTETPSSIWLVGG
jgi:hypothetical protein